MKAKVKSNQPVQEEYTYQNTTETSDYIEEGVDYSEYLAQEDESDKPLLNILEYVQNSDMMDLSYDEGRQLDLDLLRNWKAMYGKVYVSKITEDDIVYLWRPMLRLEYRRMVGTGPGKNDGTVKWDDDYLRQNEILKTCLLFPKPTDDFLRTIRAGIPSSLEQQIMYQSGFVPDAIILESITPLA